MTVDVVRKKFDNSEMMIGFLSLETQEIPRQNDWIDFVNQAFERRICQIKDIIWEYNFAGDQINRVKIIVW